LVNKPVEDVWPYIETGRRAKTFELVEKLGEGGNGAVFKEKHKLDGKIYAVKIVKVHVPYDASSNAVGDYVLAHPAMKEISAISKLNHKNIVGYKGCWVEAEVPTQDRLDKVVKKIKRREKPAAGTKTKSQLEHFEIDELEEDEPDIIERKL
jgi:serine/threonine protein kinase